MHLTGLRLEDIIKWFMPVETVTIFCLINTQFLSELLWGGIRSKLND